MIKRQVVRFAVLLALVPLASCGTGTDRAGVPAAQETAGRLLLTVESAQTGADGSRCVLGVSARNDTGAAALNVQAAWTAQTDGFGSISDYQFLGDFAADEARAVQLGIFGAPCEAVRDLKLTRAVCTVGPAEDPPKSCADLVVLDGPALAAMRSNSR
jgi:hypothetical protein